MRKQAFPNGPLTKNISREVLSIWYSRHQEIEDTEPFGMTADYYGDGWADAIREQRTKLIDEVLFDALTPREQYVLYLRHWDGLTLNDVAVELELTIERVRQIEAKALRKLKHPSSSDTLRCLFDNSLFPEPPPVGIKLWVPRVRIDQDKPRTPVAKGTMGAGNNSTQAIGKLIEAMEKHERLAKQAQMLRVFLDEEKERQLRKHLRTPQPRTPKAKKPRRQPVVQVKTPDMLQREIEANMAREKQRSAGLQRELVLLQGRGLQARIEMIDGVMELVCE